MVSDTLADVWNSIKGYCAFCRLAFAEKFLSRRYKLLKKVVWPLALFLVAWVLGAYFGIALKSVVAPIYNLLPGLAWIIIVLGLVIVFLLCLIDGARRYHNRTVNQCVLVTRTLMWYAGAMSEHLASLPPETKSDKEFCQNWLNGIEAFIKMCFVADDRPDVFRKLHNCTKPLSDHIDAQVMWANRYMANLNFIIDEQIIPIDPPRLTRKQRKINEQADAQARAWAAKRNDKSNYRS